MSSSSNSKNRFCKTSTSLPKPRDFIPTSGRKLHALKPIHKSKTSRIRFIELGFYLILVKNN
jgi:hypothetical protein